MPPGVPSYAFDHSSDASLFRGLVVTYAKDTIRLRQPRVSSTGEQRIDGVDQQDGEGEDDHDSYRDVRASPQAFDPLPEPSQLDSHLIEEAGEEQELTREQPQPDGDDDVARTRRRDEHEAGDYEYGSAQQAHGPPVSGYQTLPGAALVEMVAGLVAMPGVDLPEGAPVTPALPSLLD